jgi:hypothetical protein
MLVPEEATSTENYPFFITLISLDLGGRETAGRGSCTRETPRAPARTPQPDSAKLLSAKRHHRRSRGAIFSAETTLRSCA